MRRSRTARRSIIAVVAVGAMYASSALAMAATTNYEVLVLPGTGSVTARSFSVAPAVTGVGAGTINDVDGALALEVQELLTAGTADWSVSILPTDLESTPGTEAIDVSNISLASASLIVASTSGATVGDITLPAGITATGQDTTDFGAFADTAPDDGTADAAKTLLRVQGQDTANYYTGFYIYTANVTTDATALSTYRQSLTAGFEAAPTTITSVFTVTLVQ